MLNEENRELGRTIARLTRAKIHYIQSELYAPTLFIAYGEKSIVSPVSGDIMFLIQNKDVAHSFKSYFESIWGQKTRIYYGKKGAIKVLEESIEAGKKGEELLGFGTHDDPYLKFVPEALREHFEQQKKHKIKWKLLFAKGFKSPNPLAEVRYLPEGLAPPVRTMMYGDRVAMVDFTPPITTIIIEKKAIADAYKRHFELLWKIAEK
jgi:hypothetical protein